MFWNINLRLLTYTNGVSKLLMVNLTYTLRKLKQACLFIYLFIFLIFRVHSCYYHVDFIWFCNRLYNDTIIYYQEALVISTRTITIYGGLTYSFHFLVIFTWLNRENYILMFEFLMLTFLLGYHTFTPNYYYKVSWIGKNGFHHTKNTFDFVFFIRKNIHNILTLTTSFWIEMLIVVFVDESYQYMESEI